MLQEQEILNRKSQALKQYITDNILPVLTSGLIEICNEKPDDPLDYLVRPLNHFQAPKKSQNRQLTYNLKISFNSEIGRLLDQKELRIIKEHHRTPNPSPDTPKTLSKQQKPKT